MKVLGRVAVADGRGVSDGVGVELLGETLGVAEGKTTRDGPREPWLAGAVPLRDAAEAASTAGTDAGEDG